MGQDAFFRRARCSARGPAAIGAAAVSCFAVLFSTMLCTLFYNIWLDDLRRLTAAEGDWQLRITGQFREAQPAAGAAHRHPLADPRLSGLCADRGLFHPLPDQHPLHLF